MTLLRILRSSLFLFFILSGFSQAVPYYGAPLGAFHTISNNVKGNVFAVDQNNIFIKDFSYDGQSEDAVFWAGDSQYPDTTGFVIPNEDYKSMPISAYFNQNIILRLPDGQKVQNLRWMSVWNRNTSKSLGTLVFSKPIAPPKPLNIGPLINTDTDVSTGDILILDTQTFVVPNFSYDGTYKETYWWLSRGTKPSEVGIPLRKNESDGPLQSYKNSTVILTLPKGHFVTDYDTLSIWNRIDGDHHGFVDIPKNLNVPPSPRLLETQETDLMDFNCEMLNDNLGLELRWIIKGYDVIIHLVGNIGPNEYMALGLSKDDTETKFEASDAIVAGVDQEGKGFVSDYFFESNEVCDQGRGLCPDSIYGSRDDLELLQAERYDNSTIITFKRTLKAEDKIYDQSIYTDGPQAILWAVGQLLPNRFATPPTLQSKGNLLMDFGREPNWNCPHPRIKIQPKIRLEEKTQHIHCPGDRSFRAQLGSSPRSSVKKVWFINGLPTPDLTVQRGYTYTFIIEGGLNPPFHHPFYITNNKEGGLYKNILEGNDTIEVTYAGIQQDQVTGTIFPTAEGRLCDWSYSDRNPEYSIVTSNQEIKSEMVLKCEPGQPGKLMWTPSAETPDEIYYQSFTERNLGGKIRVVDFCEETAPHRYLEVFSVKGGKPKENERVKETEREHERSEFDRVSNMKNTQALSVEEVREKLQENGNMKKSNIPTNTHGIDYTYADKYVLSSNVINSFTENSNVINEKANSAENKQFLMSTNSPMPQVTDSPDEAFPHDESERSDIYMPHRNIAKKIITPKATVNSRDSEILPIKYPTHSASELSISALGKQSLQEFKPQFEGGFIPLVMNPMKEKEFGNTKKITYPQQHQRAHRPFLYNESVPFHGTFKPGVPDFSGFNISNYSQEDASIIIAPNQESLQLLSASKPQPVHKPFPPFGALPMYFLQNPNNPPLRNQRPQNPPHRFQHHPSPIGPRKNIFPHSQLNKHNFPMPNVRDEDLAGVPSQRVYVSRQATMEKKPNFSNNPNLQGSPLYNRKPHNTPPNKIVYPPPIQRRPDVYEDKETNIPHINIPPRKFNNPHMSANINNQHNAQKTGMPVLQSGGLQSQLNSRTPMSNLKVPPKILQDKPERQLKPPFPMTQVRPRDRIPQIPLFPNGVNLRTFPQIDEKLKHVDSLTNQPQNSGSGFPFPVHMMNQNDKTVQELIGTPMQELPSNDNRNVPHFINAELVEIPTKHIPQTISKENQINPTLLMHNMQPNIKSQTVPNIDYGKILISPGILPYPNQSGKPLSISKTENSAGQILDAYEVLDQKSNNDENQHANLKEPIKNQSHMLKESQPAISSPDHLDKSIETSIGAGISSSKPFKLELPAFLGYDSEADESDSIESVISDMDYSSYTVPFGARLKFSQNGTKIPIRILNEAAKTSFGMIRKPQMNLPSTRDKNSNGFIKTTESTTHVPNNNSTTVQRKTISTTTEAEFIAMESAPNFALDKQNISSENNSLIKNLYYTPPVYSLNETLHTTNSSSNINPLTDSNEVKHIPIIADELDGFIQASYPGRKYMLPNNSDSSILPFVIPSSATEDINLPQISEYQPVHDNRTDYSILNHVLTLIEGPFQQKSPEVSS